MTATSMTSPPASENSRNFTAAYCRRGAAEQPDEEVDRDEHRLEEDVEQEHVGGGEDADHERLEHQHQREVASCSRAAPPSSATSCQAASRQTGVRMAAMTMSDRRDAVDAEGVGDPELRDPGVLLGELELLVGPGVELQRRRAMASTSVTSEKPSATGLAWRAALPGSSGDDDGADERDHRSSGEPGAGSSLDHPHERRGWRRHRRASSGHTTGRSRSGGGAAVEEIPPTRAARPPTAPSTPRRVGEDQRAGQVDAGAHEQRPR